MKKMNIRGKIAVVTGGGGILCGDMARELGLQGCKVAILDLQQEKADAVANQIKEAGGDAIGIACNVLEKESLQNARRIVNETYGKLDVLINGAGGNHPKAQTTNEVYNIEDLLADNVTSFFDMQAEGFGFVFNLNFIGTFLTTQVFAEDMVGENATSIINISSMSAPCPMTKVPAYSAAKASVNNFTQWLAVHFANCNMRVNAIAPGFFLTDQNRALLKNADGSLTPRSEKIISHTPMRRFGEPQDLLGTLVFLLDEELSGFITGTVIHVDGGFMAYSGV